MKPVYILLPVLIAAGTASAAPQTITLKEYIGKALQNNPALRRIRADYASQAHSAQRAAALADLLFSVSGSYNYQDPVSSGGSTTGSKRTDYTLSSSLSKKFPSLLGMQATAGLGYNAARGYSASSSTGIQVNEPTISLSLTLPLLRNALGNTDRNTIKSMHLSVKILEKSKRKAVELLIQKLYGAYLDWALLEEKADIYLGFENRARTLYAQVLRKRRFRVADAADVHLANQNFLQYKALRISTELQAKRQYLNAATLLTGKPMVTKAAGDITPQWKPELEFDDTIVPVKHDIGVDTLASVQIARLELERAKATESGAASDARPDLNFVLEGSKGSSGTDFFGSFGDFSRNELYAGLEFSLSLQNTDRGQAHQAAKQALTKQQALFREILISQAHALRELSYALRTSKQVVALRKAAATASALRAAAQARKYMQGRLTLDRVTDARDAWARARMEYLNASSAYKKLAVEYAVLSDSLYGIYLTKK